MSASIDPARATIWSKLLVFLKLLKVRWVLLGILHFTVAYLSTGQVRWYLLAAGVILLPWVWAIARGVDLHADQVEDRINVPHRVRMAEAIGYRSIAILTVILYVVCMIGALMVAFAFNYTAALVVVVAVHLAIAYSWGLRLKRHPILSLVVMSVAFTAPFAFGWVIARPLSSISPIAFVIAYLKFAHGNVQTFPDAPGDAKAGVKTFFTSSLTQRLSLVTPLIVFSPIVLVLLFVLLGILETKFLLMLSVAPLATALNVLLVRFHRFCDPQKREIVWEWNLMYMFIFIMVLLGIYHHTPETGLTIAAVAGVYYLTWDFGARAANLDLKSALAEVTSVLRTPQDA